MRSILLTGLAVGLAVVLMLVLTPAERGAAIADGMVRQIQADRRRDLRRIDRRLRGQARPPGRSGLQPTLQDVRAGGGEDLKGEIWEMTEHAAHDHIGPIRGTLAGLRGRLLREYFVVVDILPEESNPEHELSSEDIEETGRP